MIYKKPEFWDRKNSIISILLLPISLIVIFVSKIKKYVSKKKFKIPVICVGNIYIGGTGKTPISAEIFDILKSYGKNPAFVKKFYPYIKDEILLLEKKGKVFCDKNRLISIDKLQNNNFNVAILDDGYQDFSIHKDLSILCFNRDIWIGNGRVIPSGPLRESISNINRANCVMINGDKNKEIEKQILKYNPNVDIIYFKYQLLSKDVIKNNKIVAFAGIGTPRNFFELLKKNNFEIYDTLSFPDHYQYKEKDISKLKNLALKNNCILLTTEKDYLRINDKFRKDVQFVELKIKIDNKERFVNLINNFI